MKWTYKDGDLLKSGEPVIAHGCNTHGVMGAGIAKQVAFMYPDAYQQYRKACHNRSFRVGSSQYIWVRNHGNERILFNLGTQEHPGADATAWGIFLSFANLAESCYRLNIPVVAIPRIGAGIGGLGWQTDVVPAIEEAMDRATRPVNITVYDFTPESN
jgi:O-acetyl-ADP-ribose deacetylase (regulator of RNase III)